MNDWTSVCRTPHAARRTPHTDAHAHSDWRRRRSQVHFIIIIILFFFCFFFLLARYDAEFNGLQSGLIREFTPLIDDKANGEVLIDITHWLNGFSIYANAAGAYMHEKLREGEDAASEGTQPHHMSSCGGGGGSDGAACCANYNVGVHTKLFGSSSSSRRGGGGGAGAGVAPPCSALNWRTHEAPPSSSSSSMVLTPEYHDDGGSHHHHQQQQHLHHLHHHHQHHYDVGAQPPMPMGLGPRPIGGGGSQLLEVASFSENFILKYRSHVSPYSLKVRPGMAAFGGAQPRPILTRYVCTHTYMNNKLSCSCW